MSEMVARVTRALCTNDPDFRCCRACGPLVAKARAAIEAMREPTRKMICRVLDENDKRRTIVTEDWAMMIDEALK